MVNTRIQWPHSGIKLLNYWGGGGNNEATSYSRSITHWRGYMMFNIVTPRGKHRTLPPSFVWVQHAALNGWHWQDLNLQHLGASVVGSYTAVCYNCYSFVFICNYMLYFGILYNKISISQFLWPHQTDNDGFEIFLSIKKV